MAVKQKTGSLGNEATYTETHTQVRVVCVCVKALTGSTCEYTYHTVDAQRIYQFSHK